MCPGKTGMALQDEQLMAIQNVYNSKDVFVWLPMDKASPLLHMYELLPLVFVPRIRFEMAYCHPGLGSHGSAWCGCTLQCIFY